MPALEGGEEADDGELGMDLNKSKKKKKKKVCPCPVRTAVHLSGLRLRLD